MTKVWICRVQALSCGTQSEGDTKGLRIINSGDTYQGFEV